MVNLCVCHPVDRMLAAFLLAGSRYIMKTSADVL